MLSVAPHTTVVERAFEIARSGSVTDMSGLRARLKLERYENIDVHLSSSPSLTRQLVQLLRAARQGTTAVA